MWQWSRPPDGVLHDVILFFMILQVLNCIMVFIITFHREKRDVLDVHDPQQWALNTCMMVV